MVLDKIITIANSNSQLRFLAMVRSLRAVGCTLPVWVIPYDNQLFELPDNCIWWDMEPIASWIEKNKLWPAFKKIQCFTVKNYQFVDSDIIFQKNPEEVLETHKGFITSCLHWNNPAHTTTDETIVAYKNQTTTWHKLVFNSGQWACDKVLYPDENMLTNYCENNFRETLFTNNYNYKDQAGINILVLKSKVAITNITLPPFNMESTWAGDYVDAGFEKYWVEQEKMPYLIHWAGCNMCVPRAVDELFYQYLTDVEKQEWDEKIKNEKKPKIAFLQKLKKIKEVLKSV
ncbi:hypothetical protein [Parasediminibacterium sp. JCM 36343]|uniref:hypothetical protein n=1 Tax=Parasediminibacterium sp. JCM 36343 TaxID=3374279 RepID=UPI00397A78AF